MKNIFFIHYIDFVQLPTIGVEIFSTDRGGLLDMLCCEERGEIRIVSIDMALDDECEDFKDITAKVYIEKYKAGF